MKTRSQFKKQALTQEEQAKLRKLLEAVQGKEFSPEKMEKARQDLLNAGLIKE
jgi:hypothetical protein